MPAWPLGLCPFANPVCTRGCLAGGGRALGGEMGDVSQCHTGEATLSVLALKYRTIAALFEMKIIYTPFMPRPGFVKRAAGNPAPIGRKGSVRLLNQ